MSTMATVKHLTSPKGKKAKNDFNCSISMYVYVSYQHGINQILIIPPAHTPIVADAIWLPGVAFLLSGEYAYIA